MAKYLIYIRLLFITLALSSFCFPGILMQPLYAQDLVLGDKSDALRDNLPCIKILLCELVAWWFCRCKLLWIYPQFTTYEVL